MYDPLPFAPEPQGALSASPDGTEYNNWEGLEYTVQDTTYGIGPVRVRCVRNSATIALAPKRLVTFKSTFYGRQVDGYADVNPEGPTFPIWDRHVSSIPVSDFCYIVVDGPTLISTGLAADATNVIPEGQWVVNGTGATSHATTSGRIVAIDMTGATQVLAKQIMERVGRCLTARTTANTATDTLVLVGKRW